MDWKIISVCWKCDSIATTESCPSVPQQRYVLWNKIIRHLNFMLLDVFLEGLYQHHALTFRLMYQQYLLFLKNPSCLYLIWICLSLAYFFWGFFWDFSLPSESFCDHKDIFILQLSYISIFLQNLSRPGLQCLKNGIWLYVYALNIVTLKIKERHRDLTQFFTLTTYETRRDESYCFFSSLKVLHFLAYPLFTLLIS